MFIFSIVTVRSFEFGLEFIHGEFKNLLPPGRYVVSPLARRRIAVVSAREPHFKHQQLDLMIASGQLGERARVIDIQDNERGLVWVDGRFAAVLEEGQHAFWQTHRSIRVETVSIESGSFVHKHADVIIKQRPDLFVEYTVPAGHIGVLSRDGAIAEELGPGCYVFWQAVRGVVLQIVDVRERALDISGQEIMTADRVTLRMNVVVGYAVRKIKENLLRTDNAEQALYRSVQLALRQAIGTRTLEELLADKDILGDDLREGLAERAEAIGLRLTGLGLRDLILPGEMKALLNQVTEAKAAAEANLITRREETAAMRSQLNTARLFNDHPALMRLRELEVLERVAKEANLQVVLGEGGLSERLSKLI